MPSNISKKICLIVLMISLCIYVVFHPVHEYGGYLKPLQKNYVSMTFKTTDKSSSDNMITTTSSNIDETSSKEDKTGLIKTTIDSEGKPLPFPVYEPIIDKEGSPASVSNDYSRPISEELELCQGYNILNFVINATDIKDECEGLRRAFEVSCRSNPIIQRRLFQKRSLSTSLSIPTAHMENEIQMSDLLILQEESLSNKDSDSSHNENQPKSKTQPVLSTRSGRYELKVCCASMLSLFHTRNCDHSNDYENEYNDQRLFMIVFVITLCGLVKSLISYFSIRWLPEAAGCILVGVVLGFLIPYDLGFDEKLFLRVMLPPIVFEAALSINKKAFFRYVTPIFIFALIGTIISSLLTAVIVYKGSHFLFLKKLCNIKIPFIESCIFGALISSIDPIAVLSVLSNMGMLHTDAIYILIFGESLLNDGVAIILFETLRDFLDENKVVDKDSIQEMVFHFFILAFGSVMVGVVIGFLCNTYFCVMHGCHSPLVEVLTFCCWSLIPYYVSDGLGWSGIVSIVAAGFVMDMYIVGEHPTSFSAGSSIHSASSNFDMNHDQQMFQHQLFQQLSTPFPDRVTRTISSNSRSSFFNKKGQISYTARTHLGFVTSIISTLMETAIFAYLGLFLFNSRYKWNMHLSFISIAACLVSRAIMLFFLTFLFNRLNTCYYNKCSSSKKSSSPIVIDKRMQIILLCAGLRGAMSFALVENLPLFDEETLKGTRLKPELKAMTCASIIFTIFILGGCTSYVMDYLGIECNRHGSKIHELDDHVVVPLVVNVNQTLTDESETTILYHRATT